jgi:hypothetical protein
MERLSNTQAMLSAGSKAKLVIGTVLLAAVAFIASGAPGEKPLVEPTRDTVAIREHWR